MSGIRIERHPTAGACTGGIYVSDDICWNVEFPAAVVSITLPGGMIVLNRDEASEVAEGLRSCLLDG